MAWGRLALLQAGNDEHALDKLAEVFGYERLPDDVEHSDQEDDSIIDSAIVDIGEATDTSPKRPPALFPRINKIVNTPTDTKNKEQPGYLTDPAMRLRAEDAPPGTYNFAAPPPLLPMARLLPFLFNGLAQAKSGLSLDHRQLMRRMEQGKPLQRLPKRQRQCWPQRLQIIVDASPRLEPYWADFAFIVRQLQILLGKEAVQALRFDEDTLGNEACYSLSWPTNDHDRWQPWQAPPTDVSILILSDLGVDDRRAAIGWQRQLATLQSHPSPLLTLSPASGSPNDEPTYRLFNVNPFNDQYPLPRHPLRNGFALDQPASQTIDDILTWLSPLPLIDSGLLRRLRIALQWGDSALEALIWNHPDVQDIGLGIQVQPTAAKGYQQKFQQRFAGKEKAQHFWTIVEQHHADAYQGLKRLEKFKQCEIEQQNDPAMQDYFRRLCASVKQGEDDPAQQQALRLQCRTVLAALSSTIWNSNLKDLAYDLYALAYWAEIRDGHWPEQLDPGFHPERFQWLIDSEVAQEKQVWCILQTGDQGQIQCTPETMAGDVVRPIVEFEAPQWAPPRLSFTVQDQKVIQMQQTELSLTLTENSITLVETGTSKLELEAIQRPSWASRIWRNAEGLWASVPWLNEDYDVLWQTSTTEVNGTWRWPTPFGEDAFGLYVDLSVKKVTQRFRWIEPGTFNMGSPEDEVQREWLGEGKGSETLHSVRLSQGFWLADTTVTQDFWQAVMGDNPSHFKDNPDNPVEQVSWQDAQEFINQLNSLFPGLLAQLPSEAQWEYACRAGTNTPFSFGINITTEQVNYDGNFPYADGETGLDRQQTVPVKSLPSNPWGLYEMHGNLWEWCADAWQQQMSANEVVDPLATDSDGDFARVVRGGSWDFYGGGGVRSAIRFRLTHDFRYGSLGFRLALGHTELRAGGRGGTTDQATAFGEGSGRRVAEQRQTGPSPKADHELHSNRFDKLPKKSVSKKDKKKK